MRGLKSQTHWPDGFIGEFEEAVRARNYLAHHFLQEYCLVAPSESVVEQATEQLAGVSNRLDNLQEALEAHLRSLGVPTVEDLDGDTKAEIDRMRPTSWLDDSVR
jgi:hypothetical protein